MQIITLYHSIREDGGTTVSPIEPTEYVKTSVRLVADEGMILTNGEIQTACIDVDNADGWNEVEEVISNGRNDY